MLTQLYRKRIAGLAVQLARDDPQLVKQVIGQLRLAGDIAADDLVYLDRIADRWTAIAQANLQRGARGTPVPRRVGANSPCP